MLSPNLWAHYEVINIFKRFYNPLPNLSGFQRTKISIEIKSKVKTAFVDVKKIECSKSVGYKLPSYVFSYFFLVVGKNGVYLVLQKVGLLRERLEFKGD
jgi:hypothetical protein